MLIAFCYFFKTVHFLCLPKENEPKEMWGRQILRCSACVATGERCRIDSTPIEDRADQHEIFVRGCMLL